MSALPNESDFRKTDSVLAAPAFSIIIPIYNRIDADRGPLLNALLSTIPDRSDLEIILVDDRSELRPEITRDFTQAKLTWTDTPSGARYAGPARNHGLTLARGTWIIFADSDDLFDTCELEYLLQELLRDDEHDVVKFAADAFTEDHQGVRGSSRRHLYFNRLLSDVSAGAPPESLVRFISPWCKAVRRAFLEAHQIGFGRTRVAEDMKFSTGLAIARPTLRIIDRPIYLVREASTSITAVRSASNALDTLRSRRESNRQLVAAGLGLHTTPTIKDMIWLARLAPLQAIREIPASMTTGSCLLPARKDITRAVRRRLRRLTAKLLSPLSR